MKENRTIIKQIRLSPEEEKLLIQKAKLCGYDHADSKFMRSCLLDNTMPLSEVKQLAYRSYSAWQSMHNLVNSIEKANYDADYIQKIIPIMHNIITEELKNGLLENR